MSQLVINVYKNSEPTPDGRSTQISNLQELLESVVHYSDYRIDITSKLDYSTIGNGTGYYDPLATAIFVDQHGDVAEDNSILYIHDTRTDRSLFIIILRKGTNIIIHDRYPHFDNGVMVVTGGPLTKVLGMNPCWTNDIPSDLVKAAEIFGYEVVRNDKPVIVIRRPMWKPVNWFKHMGDLLNVPKLKASEFLETDPE